jgi:hypothetical protein
VSRRGHSLLHCRISQAKRSIRTFLLCSSKIPQWITTNSQKLEGGIKLELRQCFKRKTCTSVKATFQNHSTSLTVPFARCTSRPSSCQAVARTTSVDFASVIWQEERSAILTLLFGAATVKAMISGWWMLTLAHQSSSTQTRRLSRLLSQKTTLLDCRLLAR